MEVLESGNDIQSNNDQNDITGSQDYNQDEVYCYSLTYSDLNVEDMMFSGMKICGTGLIISLGVIICISILRNAI